MNDQFDLHTAQIVDAPADIADWPITHSITAMAMRPTGDPKEGLSFVFEPALPETWKWFSNPQVPTDNYQYTVWAGAVVGGVPVLSAFIQMWGPSTDGPARPSTGAPILTDFHKNWAYDPRWGALFQYSPKPGDQMAFMVSAGNARDQRGPTSVKERSQVVVVTLPGDDKGDWTFASTAPIVPQPEPVPAPVPAPSPAPVPVPLVPSVTNYVTKADLDAAEARILAAIHAAQVGVTAQAKETGNFLLRFLGR